MPLIYYFPGFVNRQLVMQICWEASPSFAKKIPVIFLQTFYSVPWIIRLETKSLWLGIMHIMDMVLLCRQERIAPKISCPEKVDKIFENY